MFLGAPESNDKDLVNAYFCGTCNCYAYAVQDYFAGSFGGMDAGYLPRPGQSQGRSYAGLLGNNVEQMKCALQEDGLVFAGMKRPEKVPDDKYLICCFLEPQEYHFIRQNQDGSWSSKNGLEDVSAKNDYGEEIVDPENYYHHDPKYPFCGYFLVPKGGIIVGLRAYEKKLLEKGRLSQAQEKIIQACVDLTEKSKKIKNDIRLLFNSGNEQGANLKMELYRGMLDRLSLQCQRMNYSRRSCLKVIPKAVSKQR